MKKLWIVIGVSCIGLQMGTAIPMMTALNNTMKSTYQKYFNAPQHPYTFYGPRESYSYFSPHFNMYHYVGMDYVSSSNVTIDMIQRDLATGIRGFKFKINTEVLPRFINDGGTSEWVGSTELGFIRFSTLIEEIAKFAGKNNELVVVHIVGAETNKNTINSKIKALSDFNHLLFTPVDRLKDIANNAAKKRIVDTANNNYLTFWPRLKWNYANKKLVMITWDAGKDSEYCWDYKTYFSNDLSESKKLIEASVGSISAAIPMATSDHPTIFYSDVLKAELVSGLSFMSLIAMSMIYNYLNIPRTSTITERPNIDGWKYYDNLDAIPKEDSGAFLRAYQRAADMYSPPAQREEIWAMKSVTREQIKHLIGPGEDEIRYPGRPVFFDSLTLRLNEPYKKTVTIARSLYEKLTGGLIASVGSSLTTLGIYSIGLTKNAFTVVKKEQIPATMAVTGVFLTKPLTLDERITIQDNKSTLFNAVSQLNRDDYTVINNFERSLLMKIAHHGRRVLSPITHRTRKKG